MLYVLLHSVFTNIVIGKMSRLAGSYMPYGVLKEWRQCNDVILTDLSHHVLFWSLLGVLNVILPEIPYATGQIQNP